MGRVSPVEKKVYVVSFTNILEPRLLSIVKKIPRLVKFPLLPPVPF